MISEAFQYPQRVDLRWNGRTRVTVNVDSEVSIPSTGRFTLEHSEPRERTYIDRQFQYPQRVDLRWNLA